MPYKSSLTDAEWDVLEPLLVEILPQKKRTRPTNWTNRELLDGLFYQLKNGCNWEDLPKDLPPYSTVYWHYKQWREAGAIEPLMNALHGQVREQVKKTKWTTLIIIDSQAVQNTCKGQAKKYHPSHTGTIVMSHLGSSNAGCQKHWTGCKSSRETVIPLR